MANGIFTIETKTNEIKGKEVMVSKTGILIENGEVIDFADIFSPVVGQTINFSIKVTEKDESEFEVPEKEDEE